MLSNELYWNNLTFIPILGILQFFPLVAAIFLFYKRKSQINYKLAVVFSIAEIILSLFLYSIYQIEVPPESLIDSSQPNLVFQFAESFSILGGFAYHAGVDGISITFILLTSVLTFFILIYSQTIPLDNLQILPAILFMVEACLISQFTTLNLLWFLIASTIEIILVAYLVWYWATSHDINIAITKYLQFMFCSLFLLFTAILLLGWNFADHNMGQWSFDLFDLLKTDIPSTLQSIIFFLMFYSLAIRIPIFPLHGWLPSVAEHGTIVLAPVFLLGLKVGVYGLIRFVFPLLPEVIVAWQYYIVAFSVIGIFYAALLALMQVNMRRLLAFAVISHSGILMIGLFTLNSTAFKGSIMLSINFGLAISGLLFMTGFIFWRTRTLLIAKLGNLFDLLPFVGFCFLLAGLSIVGMPGTPGFDAVHLVLEASMKNFGAVITILAALANVLAAGFLLWSFQRAFLNQLSLNAYQMERYHNNLQPETKTEKMMSLAIIALLLMAGFYSGPWLELIDQPLNSLGELFEHAKPTH